jgi:hypothetical protein
MPVLKLIVLRRDCMVRPDEEGIVSEEKYRILGYAKDR